MKIELIRFTNFRLCPLIRQHYNDSGADIPMPTAGKILPFETLRIPLGFGIKLPDGYTARLQIRTSLACKGLIIQQCAIDAGYKGELSMILTNCSNEPFEWEEDERLGYIEINSCIYPEFVDDLGDERDTGAFGSTGK